MELPITEKLAKISGPKPLATDANFEILGTATTMDLPFDVSLLPFANNVTLPFTSHNLVTSLRIYLPYLMILIHALILITSIYPQQSYLN